MPNARPLTRGDRRRNEKLTRLRSIVPPDLAIVGIDLASAKQAAVVADHDSITLGRRMFAGDPWVIDDILDWALPIAVEAGFAGVVVGCEPTGHRWKPVLERCRARGIDLVCVNPMLVHRGREEEDFTRDRSDFKDSTIIARRVADRHCYLPYALEGDWCRLRHLGARRNDQLVESSAARQCLRDLLECVWPAVLATAAKPLESTTWRAAMAVSCDPAEIVAMGYDAFVDAVGDELARWGGQRRNHRILGAIWAAAQAPGGVERERAAALERAHFALGDWRRARDQLVEVEARMLGVLDALELTELVTTIDGLSAVGAAAILAEAGDPARFDCARTWVKHAGLCPRANESGNFAGSTRVSGRGRPALRTAAWGRLGRPAPQRGVRGPLPPPHRPGRQPPQGRPGPSRHSRRPVAPALRRRHPARRLGSGRRLRREARGGGRPGRLTRHWRRAGRARLVLG